LLSNDPNEDDHDTDTILRPKGAWSFFAVLDGHNGWETSAWLREKVVPAVTRSLEDLYDKHRASSSSILWAAWNVFGGIVQDPGNKTDAFTPPARAIDDNIKDTFKRLDDEIVNEAANHVLSTTSKNAGINFLAPAYAGSCALLAFYDSNTRLLRVAVTGDSRALLGRRVVDENGNVKYEVHVLSVDQDGNNKLEIERLNNSPEHPGEEVIKDGRVLGMGPSRAFGDARWKWPLATQKRLHREYLGRNVRDDVKTPPYLTAEPVITTTKVEKGDFLIMATDGLWECLQNEEAVGLVGAWLERNANQPMLTAKEEVLERDALPVMLPEKDTTGRYAQWAAKKEFVNADGNVATHLARNALGGADSDLARALLSMRAPRARVYRCVFPSVPDSGVLILHSATISPLSSFFSLMIVSASWLAIDWDVHVPLYSIWPQQTLTSCLATSVHLPGKTKRRCYFVCHSCCHKYFLYVQALSRCCL
jgi:pyruvate dehydrogenase phosphatase